MKSVGFGLLVIGCIVFMTGCGGSLQDGSDNWLLVNFEKDVPVTYKMTAVRNTEIDLTTGDVSKKSRPQTMTEELELEMVYTPIEVDPFGLTVLDAACTSVHVQRAGFSGNKGKTDAMERLKGEHFILKLSPTGQIADTTDLERIAKKLGSAAFSDTRNIRVKNPDLIADFLVMQQFLWDASATISNQLDLKVGDTWQAQQPIAWPVPMYPPPARTTTYTLDEITENSSPEPPAQPRKAIVTSTYALSETPMETYIRPYEEGKFQMRGLFGFLRNYQFKELTGSGRQVFNLDDGLVESDEQEYLLDVTAAFMLPLGDSVPILKVEQTFSIQRVQNAGQ